MACAAALRRGFSGGGNSYGYDVVHGADGERGERRINTQEAEVINRIFKDYASGLSPRRIAFALNDEGIPGPSGKAWGPSTINGNAKRGTGILNNELYIGRMVWNRLRYIKDPDTGKRVSKLNPKVDWVIQEMPDLRIVSQELWDAVKDRQQKLTKNTRPDVKEDKPFWERTRPKYLLSGLMKCGCCGGTYTKISANLFGCATARNKGTCNNRVNMRTDHIETMIVEALQHELMDPELYQVFVEAFTQELEAIHKARMSISRPTGLNCHASNVRSTNWSWPLPRVQTPRPSTPRSQNLRAANQNSSPSLTTMWIRQSP